MELIKRFERCNEQAQCYNGSSGLEYCPKLQATSRHYLYDDSADFLNIAYLHYRPASKNTPLLCCARRSDISAQRLASVGKQLIHAQMAISRIVSLLAKIN